MVELSTGCLCCKVRGDLAATLADLLARRELGTVMAFERIVIETSGLADPAPILHALMLDDELGRRLALGAVVATVDALGGLATLAREPISVKQVAIADRLVLTKTDLVAGSAGPLREHLQALNPTAPLILADHGRIDADWLLGPALETDAQARRAHAWLDEVIATTPTGHHDVAIETYAVIREAPVRAVALTLFLETLAEHCGNGLLRIKGILAVAEHPERPAVIHGVQHVFHPPEWPERWPSDDRRCRLVLIVRGIQRAWVEALLDAIEAEVAEAENDSSAARSS